MSATFGFMKFLLTTIFWQITKGSEWIEKIEKYCQKPLGLRRNLYVCVWGGYSCVLLCVYVWVVYSVCVCEGTCVVRSLTGYVNVSNVATVWARKIPYLFLYVIITKELRNGRCLWCNGYRRRKWIQRHEFKSWTRLIVFHITPWERYESNYSPSSYG